MFRGCPSVSLSSQEFVNDGQITLRMGLNAILAFVVGILPPPTGLPAPQKWIPAPCSYKLMIQAKH